MALPLVGAGFGGGALAAAWWQRDLRAEPWQKMHVEHEGTKGLTTRTRVIFENPKLSLQAVEVVKSPEGSPELARVVLRDGVELTLRYDKEARPSSLEAPDGSRAELSYEGSKARVDFASPDRKALGSRIVTLPVELRSALDDARDGQREAPAHSGLWPPWLGSLIGEAWAQDPDDKVTVVRHVELGLTIRVPAGTDSGAGTAQIGASCAPLSCVPVTRDVPMPGQSSVRIAVTGSSKRAGLQKPPSAEAVEPFKRTASAERSTARGVLPDVSAIVVAVSVTASACRSLKLTAPMCVPELAKSTIAGAAIHAISSYEIATKGRVVDQRAEELYYIEQARAALDREARIEVCVARDGYIRACADLSGRPLGAAPMPRAQRTVDLRRGIGGTLAGSFELFQQDGADCRFSPSPRTGGALSLTFDNERNTVTTLLRGDQRGARPDLRCSLGTANMSWSQTYTASATQSFTPAQLQSGGKLPLRLLGTMNGNGTYSFSNCRTSGGASANCPPGKSEGYSHSIEIVGELDLGTRIGSGRIVVLNAPLQTGGTWRIPAGDKP